MDGYGLLWKGNGGETEIRTQVRVSPKHAFQACAFSHSAISPLACRLIESTTPDMPYCISLNRRLMRRAFDPRRDRNSILLATPNESRSKAGSQETSAPRAIEISHSNSTTT